MYVALVKIARLPHIMDPRGLRVTKNAYFSLITHIKQLLIVIIVIQLQEFAVGWDSRTPGRRMDGQTRALK